MKMGGGGGGMEMGTREDGGGDGLSEIWMGVSDCIHPSILPSIHTCIHTC